MNHKYTDSLFEAALRQAVIDNHEAELAAIPPDSEIDALYTFSARHETRMRRLFARERRRVRLHSLRRMVGRAAVCLLLAAAVAAAIPSVRAAVMEVIAEWTSQYAKFTPGDADSESGEKHWALSRIPDGYEEINRTDMMNMLYLDYEDGNGGYLSFIAIPSSGSMLVNNERIRYSQRLIDGTVYHIFEAETDAEVNRVVWDNDGYRFSLDAFLSVEELLEIAESVDEI
ncbi:MAG: DUF4367 domain-containing protein [Oscillospiraceae bacterium]|jgi:hypothetical protein|nr:DUF4367 domain-containing protein [Oscillospiraceae bacterium]